MTPSDGSEATVAAAAALTAVTHRYGKVLALDDATVSFPAGRMVGLIGPDGVGKSTLLALIAGVRRAQSGGVVALGGDLRNRRARQDIVRRIAYMPQGLGRNLYPTLSVRENLDFFARLYGLPAGARQSRIAELLAATGLDPFTDRPAGKLSGGMKQKLSLCARPRSSDPGRADDRRRSPVAAAVLGAYIAHPRPASGHERDRRHRLHGRGAAIRLAGRGR